MKRLVRLVLLLACVSAATARSTGAACGDGILQGGEACDATAPNGDAACPGQCIQQPNASACQCATISNDSRDFAIIAAVQARIGPSATVTKGGVVVTAAAGLLYVGNGATLPSSEQAVGDKCRLLPGSNVGRLFCNQNLLFPGAFVNNGGPFAFTPPVTFSNLPAFMPGGGGGLDVSVGPAETRYLAPGFYGTIVVQGGGKLILHGLTGSSAFGRYDVLALKVTSQGILFADNPVVVLVKNALKLTGQSVLSPTPLSSVQAGDVQVDVEGGAAKLGRGAFVRAHVRTAIGNIVAGRGTVAIGQLIGSRVTLQKGAAVQLEGGCGDGVKESSEVCDPTAPGGDGACPGKCIAFGQPGQCECACTNDADCNDGNACNGVETCDNGHCALGTPPNCDDHNQCTVDCNPATGCVQVAVADGTPCDDGNECTRGDACMGGICKSGALRACNDGNDCTADSCDPAHGCQHTPLDNVVCDDNNACTVGDRCVQGVCIAGPDRDCNDLNPCTADTCDIVLGCQHTTLGNGTSCAGPSPCTALDVCSGGTCMSGVSQLCSDANPCTVDTCTVQGNVGSQTAQCKSTPIDCNDLNPCTVDTCSNGACLHAPAVNGTSCAGPSPCTALDVCDGGTCTSGVSQLCSDSNPCTTETCTVQGPVGAQTAQCHSTAVPNSTPCGPNGLVCMNGVCQ